MNTKNKKLILGIILGIIILAGVGYSLTQRNGGDQLKGSALEVTNLTTDIGKLNENVTP